jgi:hypothetical protein
VKHHKKDRTFRDKLDPILRLDENKNLLVFIKPKTLWERYVAGYPFDPVFRRDENEILVFIKPEDGIERISCNVPLPQCFATL